MKRLIPCFLALILCVTMFSSCFNRNNGGPTLSVTQPVSVPDSTQGNENPTEQVSGDNGGTDYQTTTDNNNTTLPSTTTEKSKETMVFSSDPSNPFIQAVVNKYGVSTDTLVAYYAGSMNTNGNLVFEFDGSKGADGRPVRTKDTLKNIYTVSAPPELLAKKASGSAAEGNEYDEKETKLCKYFTEQVVFRFFSKDLQNA